MKILVTGSRDWWCEYFILEKLQEFEGKHTLIHGGGNGADKIADMMGKFLEWDIIVVKAEWTRFARAAGPIRNIKMLDEHKPDIVLAFPTSSVKEDSPGTHHCITQAQKRGIETRVYPERKQNISRTKRFNPDVPGGIEELGHLPRVFSNTGTTRWWDNSEHLVPNAAGKKRAKEKAEKEKLEAERSGDQ